MASAETSDQQDHASNGPVKPDYSFRIANLSASVFRNSVQTEGGDARVVRSVVLQRRYYDRQAGQWKTAKNLGGLAEVCTCIRLLEKARDYLESVEQDGTPPF